MNMRGIALAAIMTLAFSVAAHAGNLSVSGSTTVLPIMQKAVEAYMAKNPGVGISVSGGGSGNGIKALIDGTTDIAMSSRFIKDKEVASAVAKGRYPVPYAVAIDAIIPIVHPSNPVADLTLDQLKGIYTGRIKSWKEIGGPDKEIVVISRDTSSGTYESWDELVMQKERVFPRALLQASSGAVVQAVSRNAQAVGYVGTGYLDKSTKALKVGGIEGNQDTAVSGAYPISRYLYVFTPGWPEGEALRFVMFLLHPDKGQDIVRQVGYVPLY
jgi:phosphate transport system substrate-binding protein